jgi:lysophospholipase
VRAVAGACLVLLGAWSCERKPAQTAQTRIPAGLQTRFYPPPGLTWGTLEVEGAPPLRYGVASPSRAVRGEVLILPDAGEPAEAWFETASDLVARNYVVWMVDWAGQGGSARWWGTRERAYTPSMDLDVAAIRAMVSTVVRPRSRAPLVLVGDGLGAKLALRALADGLPGAAGAVLGDPMLKARGADLPGPVDGQAGADWAARLGLGRLPAPGEDRWREGDAQGRGRWAVGQTWMRANPELRLGGASLGWVAAYNRSAADARDPARLGRIKVPVLMLARPGAAKEAKAACGAIRGCRFEALNVEGPAPHLAADPVRERWLAQVAAFIEARAAGHVVAAAPVRN